MPVSLLGGLSPLPLRMPAWTVQIYVALWLRVRHDPPCWSLCSCLGPLRLFQVGVCVPLTRSLSVGLLCPPRHFFEYMFLIVVKDIKHKIDHLSVFKGTVWGCQTHSLRPQDAPPSVPTEQGPLPFPRPTWLPQLSTGATEGAGPQPGGGQQQGESCPPPWGGGGEGTGRARVPSQPWGSGALEASDMASGPRALQAQPTGPTVSWGDGNTSRLLFQHPRKQNRRELLRGARQIHCQQDANETKLISSKQRMAFSSEV